MQGIVRSRSLRVLAALVALVVVAGCQPERPSGGRGTPVRRVLLIGDSVTHGLFGVSPKVHDHLRARMQQRGIALTIDGFPGENPMFSWDGRPRWADALRYRIQTQNPDMVIIQSMLFPDGGNPFKHGPYMAAVKELLDIAQSRGAHTYLVKHYTPVRAQERHEMQVAERLQAAAAKDRRISGIPFKWWMDRCERPFISDGWHLSANGQVCYANALTAAIDQLVDANR